MPLEILTENGFKPFIGVRREKSSDVLKISFEDNTCLKCTSNHLVKIGTEFVEAGNLHSGTVTSTGKMISRIESSIDEFVYDAMNVSETNSYITNGVVSHNCSFLGSQDTLISGTAIKNMVWLEPVHYDPQYQIRFYEDPIPSHRYIMTVDVSRGVGIDYSAFSIIDISDFPYRQVATLRNNLIFPHELASIVYDAAKKYNSAYVLIENNDAGGTVCDTLYGDFEYENLYSTKASGPRGVTISQGFGRDNAIFGIRTTKRTKRLGCIEIKNLIEHQKLIVNDINTINECSTFAKKGDSYEADEGSHDDLMMTLVLFGWLVQQNEFTEYSEYAQLAKTDEAEQILSGLELFGQSGPGDLDVWDLVPNINNQNKDDKNYRVSREDIFSLLQD